MIATLTDTRFLIGAAVGYFLLPRVVKFAMGQVSRVSSSKTAAA